MSSNPITIRNLGPEDAHILDRVRSGTFDNDIDPARAWAFLATRVNELVVALDRGEVIGFASGTVIMHPDKPTKFFINEVSVHPDFRRQGIAMRLLTRISDLAADRGCEEVWVATEADNAAARNLYARLSSSELPDVVVYSWSDPHR
jgi:ribosomal protein S18 acetylase RimI-like enzyme